MDEELLKRNTDCVYFLASPLTCKKGNECEYRHSEMARLNPRDCWYWLSGSCLNPTCAFRHPPLDVHAGAVAESPHCSTPVNKTNAPCYFYFHGFCNKGDRCSFMHGPDGNAPTGKCTKTASTSSEPALENKTSARSERGSAPVEIQQCESVSEDHCESVSKYPCESVSKVPPSLHVPPREELKQPVPKNLLLQSASPPVSVCEYDDVVIRSESFISAEGFLQGRSYDCTDQSSEEEVEDHTEHEERWDSSPGFDVLVDDKSENLGYEDDLEYLQDLDREHRERSSHLLVYDVEDSLEYDLEYHKPELRCERDICNGFDHLGDEHFFSNVKRVPGHSRHKMLDSILSSKRKLVPMGLAVGDGSSIDLRDHLRRRKVIDGRQINGLSRRHGSSYLIDRSQKRPRRHGMGQRLHRRLASEVGKNTIELLEEKGTCLNGGNQYGLLKWSQQDRSKKHFRKRRLPKGHFSNEIWRKPIKRDRISTQESTIFTGPKTLSQIKEEKQKAEENGGYNVKIGNSGRTTLADFRGPKPLSEILQDKSRLDSAGECWPLRKLTRRS